MFSYTMVKTLVESQLDALHPIRSIRASMLDVLRSNIEPTRKGTGLLDQELKIGRKTFASALLWRGLFSVRNQQQLIDELRFDLRCQWFVGFCLHRGEWSHEDWTEASDIYLKEPKVQAFFKTILVLIREEGFHRSELLSLNMGLLEAWADPSCILPSDEASFGSSRSGNSSVRPDWSCFEGRRSPKPMPGTSYRPGYQPNNNLGGQLHTTRALANAQLGTLTVDEIVQSGGPLPAYITQTKVKAISPAPTNETESSQDGYDPQALMQSLMQDLMS